MGLKNWLNRQHQKNRAHKIAKSYMRFALECMVAGDYEMYDFWFQQALRKDNLL